MGSSQPEETTFLLTDVEGSTRLWEEHPGPMAQALAHHDAMVADIAAAHDGRLVKARGEGDSCFVVFDSAAAAVTAALVLQRRLATAEWPDPIMLRVRMALHCGPTERRDGDFYGPTVNRCARLRAAAHGFQVLLSDAVVRRVGDGLPPGASVVDLGVHRLRDLHDPEQVWQLVHPSLVQQFPPPNTVEAAGTNLPELPTSFVGREADLAALRDRLVSSRLVTLTGPGGAGKTRLAMELARTATGDFRDGVWFVDFSPVADPSLVVERVAQALWLKADRQRATEDLVIDYLGSREALLVMDNCEHLVDTCAHLVQRLLGACGAVRVVATSRELLRIYGEAVYPVPPLGLPDTGSTIDPSAAMEHESVQLFRERAALVDPAFGSHLDQATVESVVEICRQLEGMPLAIELAAAMLTEVDVQELTGRLHDRLATLDRGPRDVPRRQQTLRAAIDWSYDLLGEAERRIFRRLAVFAGGVDEPAAAGVAAAADDPDGSGRTVAIGECLRSLAERSLLVAVAGLGEPRYRMLETIREYALERLDDQGELVPVRRRHLEWFLNLAQQAASRMRTPAQAEALEQLDREQDNIRGALDWAAEVDPAAAARLALSLSGFWGTRGSMTEGQERLVQALAALPADATERARLLVALGDMAFRRGERATALEKLGESRRLARDRGDRETEARATFLLAAVHHDGADAAQAEPLYQEAIQLLDGDMGQHTVLACFNGLGMISLYRNDYPAARHWFTKALEGSEQRGDTTSVATVTGHLGYIEEVTGDREAAGRRYEEELRLHEEAGNRTGAGWAAMKVGGAVLETDHERALTLFEKALAVARDNGTQALEGGALNGLAGALELLGRYDESEQAAERALAIHTELDTPIQAQYDVFQLADIAHARGDHERAEKLGREAIKRALALDDRLALATALEIVGRAVSRRDVACAENLLGAVSALRRSIGLPELDWHQSNRSSWFSGDELPATMTEEEALRLAEQEAPAQ